MTEKCTKIAERGKISAYEWKEEKLRRKGFWGILMQSFGETVFWVRRNYQVNHWTFPDLPSTGKTAG